MKIQFEIDRNGFATVLRTMAALLIGSDEPREYGLVGDGRGLR